MREPSIRSLVRDGNGRLRWPIRLVWNDRKGRPRLPVRLVLAFGFFLVLAGFGNQFRPTLLAGEGPLVRTVNMIGRQLPNAVGLALAVGLAAVVIDRRELGDLGFHIDGNWWRGLAGGTALGAAITLVPIGVGIVVGYYQFDGLVGGHTLLGWLPLAIGAVIFQLLFVVPEEWFARGYVITNVAEDLNGLGGVPPWAAAGVGIVLSAGLFYVTHAAGKGATYGLMAAVLAVLLGLGYVLSGDLSVPIGIHFGFNIAGVLAGTNPQPASLLQVTSRTTIRDSLALPVEAVIARMVLAAAGLGLLGLWYYGVGSGLRVHSSLLVPDT